ncbi:MAG: DUF421 domain-containing protein [Shimia sp.]
MDWTFLHDGARPILTTLIATPLAYFGLVLLLRLGGQRTLADFNAFDFVVSVAMGSLLAATIVNDAVPLTEGLAALAVLVALQTGVAWAVARSGAVRRVVQSEPRLLVRHGAVLTPALRRARLSEADLRAALRGAGHAGPEGVAAVVLESNGQLSVLAEMAPGHDLAAPVQKGVASRRSR